MEQKYMLNYLLTIVGFIFLLLSNILNLNVFVFSIFIFISIASNFGAFVLWMRMFNEHKQSLQEKEE